MIYALMESVLKAKKSRVICLLIACFLGNCSLEAVHTPPAPTYTFVLLPKAIKMSRNHNEIRLSLVLGSACKGSKIELEARGKNGSTRFIYSKALKRFMQDLNLKRSDLRPLEKYLKRQLKNGLKNPSAFISMLASNPNGAASQGFTLDVKN